MAFIGESRKNQECGWEPYVCLDARDCELLMKAVGQLVGRCLRTVEYYKGILEGGEATEKQEDKLCQAQEDFESVIAIRDAMLGMIKSKENAKRRFPW